jgi:uncharacterized protein
MWIYLWLGFTAFAAATVNSVAGGGTLLTFPALLAVVPSVVANATSTVALVPGSLAAAWGYRRELEGNKHWLMILALPSLAGGIAGSLLVTCLDPKIFDALIPWLILTAAILFLVQPILARRATSGVGKPSGPWALPAVVVFQFFVAVYGGYFGAGIGILMLSSLGFMGLGNIHAMNAVKNFLAVFINGMSVIVFIFQDAVQWEYAAVMAPLAAVGAYSGARIAQRLDRRLVRCIVLAIGFGLAGYFFYKRLVQDA